MATFQRDYYEVLGVPREADQKAIKEAFRKLALQYHPDRNKAPDAGERFKEIAEAYAILSDPKKRVEYDSQGFAGVAGLTPEDLFGGINFEDLLGGLHFDFGGGSFFDRFFRYRPSGPARGANMEVEIVIPLERVASGGVEKVHLTHPEICPLCKGSGARPGTTPRSCPECKGSGHTVKSRREGGITLQQITPCLTCHGRGILIDQFCLKCEGKGEVRRDEVLEVTIPAGVEEGMALRIPGKGMPSEEGGLSGDLFVVVQSRPDSKFKREGSGLWRAETIPLTDAVLGTTLDVPTLGGTATVKIPPGTQPDALLRLRGKGLPEFGSRKRGDLFLRIQVHLPEKLSAEERKLYERLRELGSKDQHRHL